MSPALFGCSMQAARTPFNYSHFRSTLCGTCAVSRLLNFMVWSDFALDFMSCRVDLGVTAFTAARVGGLKYELNVNNKMMKQVSIDTGRSDDFLSKAIRQQEVVWLKMVRWALLRCQFCCALAEGRGTGWRATIQGNGRRAPVRHTPWPKGP